MGKNNYFSDLSHPNQIYWFGFICFSSFLYKDKLKIYFKDKSHLEKLSEEIGIEFPIKKENGFHCLIIQNPKILKDLEKNQNEIFEENLVRHYWRGVLDAKGIVGPSFIKFKNDLETCEEFMKFCKIFVKSKAKVHKSGKDYAFSIKGKNAKKIINLLYVESKAHLDKFKNKATENWDFI
jgi:hypothetical protein